MLAHRKRKDPNRGKDEEEAGQTDGDVADARSIAEQHRQAERGRLKRVAGESTNPEDAAAMLRRDDLLVGRALVGPSPPGHPSPKRRNVADASTGRPKTPNARKPRS
jgi:hypothetical protein